MGSPQETTIDPKLYLRMFRRRKGVIGLCSVSVLCAAFVGLDVIPKEYESEASIVITDRQRLTNQVEAVMGGMRQPSGGWKADEKRMDDLKARVRSRPFLERVVRSLNMHEDPEVQAQARKAVENHPEVALDEMATRIIVRKLRSKIRFGQAGSGIYKIIVSDSDPENAQILARWISELFVDVSIQNSLDQLRTAHEFGVERLRIYEEQLREAEQALEQYKRSVIDQGLQGGVVGTGNIAQAEALLNKVMEETDLARVRLRTATRDVMDVQLLEEGNGLLDDPDVLGRRRGLSAALKDDLTNRLLGRERQVGDWPPTGTYANLMRGALQLLETRVDARYSSEPETARKSLVRFALRSLEHDAQVEAGSFLAEGISGFKAEARSEPRGEMELARLESEVSKNRSLLASFQSQLVASDVGQALESTNLGLQIEILDPPQVPLLPVRPDRTKILLAAFLMGPILGAAVAFVSEWLDSTLRSLGDFQRIFSGPVLGTTPLVSRVVVQQPGTMRRHWVLAAVTGVIVITVLFFLTRDSILSGVVGVENTIQVVEPKDAVTP